MFLSELTRMKPKSKVKYNYYKKIICVGRIYFKSSGDCFMLLDSTYPELSIETNVQDTI